MTGESNANSENIKNYPITHIKTFVPLVLDLDKLNYDAWRVLMTTHCRASGVLGHLDGTSASTIATNAEWSKVDSLVTMLLYGTLSQPSYDHLKVFGCLCYPHISTPHKLAPRSTPCVFLGYPSQHRGYWCLDLSTRKIILSRHVYFDESSFPFRSMTPNQPPTYTFLDHPFSASHSSPRIQPPTPTPTSSPGPNPSSGSPFPGYTPSSGLSTPSPIGTHPFSLGLPILGFPSLGFPFPG